MAKFGGVGARTPLRPFEFYTPALVALTPFQDATVAATGLALASAIGTTLEIVAFQQTSTSIAAAVGTATAAAVTNATVAATGSSLSSATGTALETVAAILTGTALSAAIASAAEQVSFQTTALALTTATGTVGKAVTAILTGTAITGATGTTSETTTALLTGTALTAAVGTPTKAVAAILTSAALASAVGTTSETISYALTGLSLVSAAGTAIASAAGSASVAATALALAAATGNTFEVVTFGLTANQLLSSAGTVVASTGGSSSSAAAIASALALAIGSAITSVVNPVVILLPTSSEVFARFKVPAMIRRSAGSDLFTGAPYVVTADHSTALGQKTMPGNLLVGGPTGYPTYFAVASGTVTIPATASGQTFNLLLCQNYFTPILSDPMATSTPQSLAVGTFPWTLIARINGNGKGNGILISDYNVIINGVIFSGTLASNQNNIFESVLQLSLAAQFTGALGGSDQFQATLNQFELRR